MSTAGSIDSPVEIIGGLVTDMAPALIPAGVSIECANLIFSESGIATRPGMLPVIGPEANTGKNINYVKTYINPTQVARTLYFDTFGDLMIEDPTFAGNARLLSGPFTNSVYAKSTTLFNREYIAFSDGKFGADRPVQFDDAVVDPISQTGPGAPPTAVDGGGGSITAGVHKISVSFVTDQEYITEPAPFGQWTAGGSKTVNITNVPIGPPNVVQRIIMFTATGGSNFYYIPGGAMVMNDNTSTATTIDFTDSNLLAGTNVDYLFRLQRVPASSGVIDYSQRLFWWGSLNPIQNFVNLDFDGGFNGANTAPLGWTVGGGSGGGALKNTVFSPTPGFAIQITSAGVLGTKYGFFQQTAYQDNNGAPILQPSTLYSARFSAHVAALTNAGGTLTFEFFSAGSGSLGQATINVNDIPFIHDLYFNVQFSAATPANIPADTVLRFYNVNSFSGVQIVFDNLEIIPVSQPYQPSTLIASRAEDPESYDDIFGLLTISEDNGQVVKNAFKLRERLYIVKEHSMFVTQDDLSNEPSGWSITQVSGRVGTPSFNGVGIGEDWVVIVAREGLYIFSGGEPQKISQEIGHSVIGLASAWDRINWQYGNTVWVTVDTNEKRIYIGAPFGSATSPDGILMMDYRDLDDSSAIANSPPIRISYRGTKIVMDKSRKWCPWAVSANCCAMIERPDGTSKAWFGSGAYGNQAGACTLYELTPGQFFDSNYDGLLNPTGVQFAIISLYVTAFTPQREAEAALQLNSHRKLFTYLTMYCEGAGALSLTAYVDNVNFPQPLPSLFLQSPMNKDMETTINVLGERVAFAAQTNSVGSWFRMQKLTPSLANDPWSPVRGQN